MQGFSKCAAVRYTTGDPLRLVNCHCGLCRSLNGSAFTSYVVVRSDSFVVHGQEALGAFIATDYSTKHFCKSCGTPIYNVNPSTYPRLAMIYLGSIEKHHEFPAGINIYCSSKLGWVDSIATQPSFPEAPQRGA